MLTESTKNAVLCIELIDDSRYEEFEKALNELSNLIDKNLGGISKIQILNNVDNEILLVE
jgi:DNA/RNA-binding domain of Phe-tRNA-synthetase-like protein